MRAFLDTNVLVSALLRPEGPPGRVLASLYQGGFDLVASVPLIEELRRAVTYPRIRTRLIRPRAEVDRWIDGLTDLAEVVEDLPVLPRTSRDAADDVHLAAALAGRAEVLVTGDRDLLSVREFEGLQVVTRAAFLDLLDRARRG